MPDEQDAQARRESRWQQAQRMLTKIRQWIRQHPFRALVGFLSLILLGGLIHLGLETLRFSGITVAPSAQRAVDLLDQDEFEGAERMARRLGDGEHLEPAAQALRFYVLGHVVARDAGKATLESERRRLFQVASRYLEEGHKIGWPTERHSQAVWMLGYTLFHSGQATASLPYLLESYESGPTAIRHHACYFVCRAFLLDSPPNLPRASHYAQRLMQLRPESRDQQIRDRQLAIDVLITAGELEVAETWLEETEPTTATLDAHRFLWGRWALAKATQSKAAAEVPSEQWQALATRAVRWFEQVVAIDSTQNDLVRQAQLMLGQTYALLGSGQSAETQFSRTRWRFPDTAEAEAATLWEAEIQLNDARYPEAIRTMESFVETVKLRQGHSNRWLSAAARENRIRSQFDLLLSRSQFGFAATLSRVIPGAVPDEQAKLAEAETLETWGKRLLESSDPVERALGREKLREAAVAFEGLAELRFDTRHYPGDLLRGGENFIRGQNYYHAARMFRRHLEHVPFPERGRGLLLLSESLFGMGQFKQIEEPLVDFIESFPRHPEVYRARLLYANVLMALQRSADAVKVLEENLYHERLTPESLEWRESLFLLGRLHYYEAIRLDVASVNQGLNSPIAARRREALPKLAAAARSSAQAIERLEEVVARAKRDRHPIGESEEQLQNALYMLAESYRRQARYSQKRLSLEQVSAVRTRLEQESRTQLTQAIQFYGELELRLDEQAQVRPGTIAQKLLRNLYFNKADAYFDLRDYARAAESYEALIKRFGLAPITLEAYVQQSRCYRELGDLNNARLMIRQAMIVLGKINPDQDFSRTTRYTRPQWETVLGWLASR